MDFFNNIKDKTGKLSEKYSTKQKVLLGGLALGLVVVTTAMIIYLTRPNYVTLYRDIDLKTASEVTSQLDELNIPYRLNQDNSISVPDTYINKAKIDLAGAGLPDATFDYNDLINRNSMFMSDDEKNQARNYALQNEIANVIQSILSNSKELCKYESKIKEASLAGCFSWHSIADRYIDIYKKHPRFT